METVTGLGLGVRWGIFSTLFRLGGALRLALSTISTCFRRPMAGTWRARAKEARRNPLTSAFSLSLESVI